MPENKNKVFYINGKPITNPGKRERLQKKKEKKKSLLKKVLVNDFLKDYEEEEAFNEQFEREREAENKVLQDMVKEMAQPPPPLLSPIKDEPEVYVPKKFCCNEHLFYFEGPYDDCKDCQKRTYRKNMEILEAKRKEIRAEIEEMEKNIRLSAVNRKLVFQ